MTELATRIKKLRGDLTQEEFAKKCKLGKRTIAGLEAFDDNVRLRTLRQIRKACGLSTDEWLNFLIDWIKAQLGPDFYELKIEKTQNLMGDWILEERTDEDLIRLFKTLRQPDQQQIIKAMQRKEVLACLYSINSVWAKLEAEHTEPVMQ